MDASRPILLAVTEAKRALRLLTFSMFFVTKFPPYSENGSKVSPVFLPVCVLVISFPVAFDSSYQIQPQVIILSLPHSCKTKQHLCTSGLFVPPSTSLALPFYFSSIRISLLLYAGLLPPLLISCLLGWTFFELEGGINQLSWTLPSKGLYPMVGTSLTKVRSVFLNPSYDLLFFLVLSYLHPELYHLMVPTAKTAQKFCIQRQFFFVFKCEVHYSLLSP